MKKNMRESRVNMNVVNRVTLGREWSDVQNTYNSYTRI